jgi:membrane-associated phospholipid phosphatase
MELFHAGVTNTMIFNMKKIILFLLILLPASLFSQNIDVDILKHINSPQPRYQDHFFRFVSNSDAIISFGVPAGMALVGLISKDKTLTRNGCEAFAGVAITAGFTFGLKYAVKRERPFNKYPGIIVNHTYKSIKDPSFPSGHTSIAFSLATSLSMQYPKWYIAAPAYMWTGAVGYSRMELGAHYPSDVLGGALTGVGSSYLVHKLNINK